MNWVLQSFEKYADFNGRSRRTEYWMFVLIIGTGEFLMFFIADTSKLGAALAVVFLLGIITPSLALTVRRLHDTSHSGWWCLIGLIPILGSIPLLYLMGFKDSDPGENEYGPNPKTAGTVPPETVGPETTQIGARAMPAEDNYECKTEFPPPGPLRNKGKETDSSEWVSHGDRLEEDKLLEKVTEEEFAWITDFAIQIKPRLPRILTYDPGNYGHRGLSKDPKLSYLRNLRYSLHIGPLLELRRDFPKSKAKELPTAEWFADNVVPKPRDIPFGISYPQEEEHLRWGNILREEFSRSLKLEKQTPSALR